MSDSIPAAVIGATGYVGGELLRLVAGHPQLDLVAAVSESRAGDPVADVFPHLGSVYDGTSFAKHGDWLQSIDRGGRLALFSAAPHGASAAVIEQTLNAAQARDIDVHVVDSSADFRYAAQDDYEAVYNVRHGAPGLLDKFACALPEHTSGTPAAHVGHPGCFATAALLAIVPLLRSGLSDGPLFVNGITGSTGSGRSAQPGPHHPERHSNLYAYKPLAHRHAPEIARLAGAATGRNATVNFVPHSGPFARGIHVTVQAKAAAGATTELLNVAFADSYAAAPFVDIVAGTPRLKDVVASNACRIGFALTDDAVVVMSAIDNLVKGAAGGAVQWMNRLWDLPETAGLLQPAPAWT